MKKLKSVLAVWRILSICFFIIAELAIIPFAVLLQLLIDGTFVFDTGTIAIASFGLTFAVLTFFFHALLVKNSSRTKALEPCRISLNAYNAEIFVNLIKKKIKIKKYGENWWYGKERLRKKLRVFVVLFEEENFSSDLSTMDNYVSQIDKRTRFPSHINWAMHQELGRIQFFLYKKVPQEILHTATREAELNIQRGEFLVNLFVSLDDGVLFIPYCCSPMMGITRLYLYAVKRVEQWLFNESTPVKKGHLVHRRYSGLHSSPSARRARTARRPSPTTLRGCG